MATILDVAKASGVSPATVSYVLNNGPRTVRPATRERVLLAIQQLGYEPNAVARGLRRKRMDTFGIVLPHPNTDLITSPYFGPVMDGILRVAMQKQQNTTIFTGAAWSDAERSLPIYCDGRCDGLILLSPPVGSAIVPGLAAKNVPFVLLSDASDDPGVSSVDVDNVGAAKKLVRYLIQQGHRRIAILCGNQQSRSAAQRFQGYRLALEEQGIPFIPSLALSGQYAPASGYENALELARRPDECRPTALFCSNDEIALGAYRALEESGLRIPEDVSVVGFDDIASAADYRPPLTTVRQPLEQLGERATRLLLGQIEEGVPRGRKETLCTRLILRESVAPPRKNPCRSAIEPSEP
jgi:LacI family transcriptional regulator